MPIGTRSVHIGPKVGQRMGFISDSLGAGMLIAMIGDSHDVGASDPAKASSAFKVAIADPLVAFNGRYAAGSGVDPPVWTNFSSDLVFRSLAAIRATMGAEITLGRALRAAVTLPAIESIGGNGYVLDSNWKPTSTFMLATTGTNLFNTFVARMRTLEGKAGHPTSGVVVFLGANDAAAGGSITANFLTNLTALFAALRTAFGATLPIVLVKVSANEAITPADLATVLAAQATVVAADGGLSSLVDGDDLTLLGDSLHFNANANLTLGSRIGFAMRTLLGIAPQVVTTPTPIGWGPAEFGSGNLSPTSFGGAQNGDLEIMAVMTGVLNGSLIATPSGWTAIGTLTTSGATGLFVNFNVFARQVTTVMLAANGGHTAPTSIVVTDNHNLAQIICIRGPNALDVTNIEAFSLWPENAFANPKTIPAVTSLSANSGIVVFSGGWTGGINRTQTLTNATMTGFAQLQDGVDQMPSTNSFCNAISSGSRPTAGSTGTINVAITGGNVIGMAITVVVKP